MTEKAKAAHVRIDATKQLSEAGRAHALRLALCSARVSKALADQLTDMGYEPMMFARAFRILLEEPKP